LEDREPRGCFGEIGVVRCREIPRCISSAYRRGQKQMFAGDAREEERFLCPRNA